MTTNEITETLTEIRNAVEAPPVDQVAFQQLVGRERRRRATGRVVMGVVAVAAVAAAGTAAGLLPDRSDPSVEGGPAATGPAGDGLSDTVYFVLDGQLSALDPHGTVHDLGVRSEGVIGWTSERVYALDSHSQVEVRRADYGDEGSLVPTFSEEPSPVQGPVQSVVLSGDARYLAWLDTDDEVHRYDLAAGREDVTFSVSLNTALAGVAAEGVLVSEDGDLSVRDAQHTISVPVGGSGYGVHSDIARGLVLVGDRDGVSRLYDISEGSAVPDDELQGTGALGPYGERVALIVPDPADRAHLEVWDGGGQVPVTGLEGTTPGQVRWADETTLLVTASAEGADGLYACDIDMSCELVLEGEVGLNS
jgi:hypothetical protein